MRSSTCVGTSWPEFLPLNFIHFSISIGTPLAHVELHIRRFFFSDGKPCFPPNSSYLPFKLHFDLPPANLNSNRLDITDWAKRHWNSISPTPQAGIIWKYKECCQLFCAMDDMYVPVFVGPDEMGDLVDDTDTMFNW